MQQNIDSTFLYDLGLLGNRITEAKKNLSIVEQLVATTDVRKKAFKQKNTHITNPASIDRMFDEEIQKYADLARVSYMEAESSAITIGATLPKIDVDEYVRRIKKETPQRGFDHI